MTPEEANVAQIEADIALKNAHTRLLNAQAAELERKLPRPAPSEGER